MYYVLTGLLRNAGNDEHTIIQKTIYVHYFMLCTLLYLSVVCICAGDMLTIATVEAMNETELQYKYVP